jgi:hypothetical protein
VQQILEELETIRRMSAMVNISNHKSLKLVHLLVQYFIPREGLQTRV